MPLKTAVSATLRSWAEVDLSAILRNTSVLASVAGPAVKLLAVVKANAYGHGATAVAGALAGRVAMLGVANLAEAVEIFPHARGTPVCLLGGVLPDERAEVVVRGFIPVVSSSEEAADYSALASGARFKIHLAVDTGMGRLGIREDAAVEAARRIMALPGIELAGISSHLPVADEDAEFTRRQLERFHSLAAEIRAAGARDAEIHVENSAALLAFPRLAGTIARPGLALYGESPLPQFQPKLERALTWKTSVLLVRDFEKGRGVSYGRTFITDRPTRVATLATGYADGYPRQVSGRGGAVLIGGRRCAILGRVTMDQMMADVTDVNAAPGDEAVLLGSQGRERITATELAGMAGTIPWDIFTGIGPRVARIHHGGDACASQAANPA